MANDSTIFTGAFDGANGLVYRSGNGGLSFTAAAAGQQSLKSIAVSSDFSNDGAILAGNTDGRVYLSVDLGVSYTLLPSMAATGPLSGSLSVAFAPRIL